MVCRGVGLGVRSLLCLHGPAGEGECLLGRPALDSGSAHCPPMGSSDDELFSLTCSGRDSSVHLVPMPPGGTHLSRLMSTGSQRPGGCLFSALLLLLLAANA